MNEYEIYPKQFRNLHVPVERNRCFFLMPFSKDFDYIYGIIKKELNEAGYVCNRADEISGSKPILNKIMIEILRAQFIIADLSGYNPNVFYELGISHTFKDASEILLLKQKSLKIPFDLSHLTYIEYESSNSRLLVATILRFIEENQPFIEFSDALNLRGVIQAVDSNNNEFIGYLHNCLHDHFNTVIALLANRIHETNEQDVELLLKKYEDIICDVIIRRSSDSIFQGVLRTYFELIISATEFKVSEYFITHFMDGLFNIHAISDIDVLSWRTDFILALARNQRKLNLVVPWIINYFARSKSGTIDLNRYKLESFLMTTTVSEIDNAIAVSVFDKDCHVREHMSDIIGEKKLISASVNIYKQLLSEDNFFTAASMISALGKLGQFEAIYHINDWITNHEAEIYLTKQFFVLRHALVAITQLDNSPNTDCLNAFNKKFNDVLNRYFIL